MRLPRFNILTIMMALAILLPAAAYGQRAKREITPVLTDDKKPQQPTLHYYDKHGEPLENPVLFLAELDTVTKVKAGPKYPLYNGVDVGVNFGDLIFMLAGQRHYSYDLHASVSLHNWFFPIVEAGVGFANSAPEGANYRYKGNPSFYAKVGLNYNFLYKSSPDYMVYLGLRAGYSNFSYELKNVDISADYWEQTSRLDIPGQKAWALYGEAVAGLKVKIAGCFSLGWSVRYKMKFKATDGSNSIPWFIPGYGTSPIGMTVSAIFTIPAGKE